MARRTLTEAEVLLTCTNVSKRMRDACLINGWDEPEQVLRGLSLVEQPGERLEAYALAPATLWGILLQRVEPATLQ